jgi:polysaccharide biosynthesis protein PslH
VNRQMLKILCYKNELSWPRSAGHDVALYHLMQEFARLGASVGFASRLTPTPKALKGLDLAFLRSVEAPATPSIPASFTALQERYRSYWGVPQEVVARLGGVAREFQADAVVVSGLMALPLLGALDGFVKIWHAGDEWLLHHFSLVKPWKPATWPHVRAGVVKGIYERSFGRRLERVWVVTKPDAAFMRWATGVRNVDILPSGVDAGLFRAVDVEERANSLIFWGRLDFEPNIQALEWFFESRTWSELRTRHSDATFSIMGFSPGPEVNALASIPGVSVLPDVDDIRPVVSSHAVVALPMVSGAGIKNKLLEAAALGKAIVCTPRAMLGLQGTPPVRRATSSREFVEAISELWASAERRTSLGREARSWVVREHSWEAAARIALHGIETTVAAMATLRR